MGADGVDVFASSIGAALVAALFHAAVAYVGVVGGDGVGFGSVFRDVVESAQEDGHESFEDWVGGVAEVVADADVQAPLPFSDGAFGVDVSVELDAGGGPKGTIGAQAGVYALQKRQEMVRVEGTHGGSKVGGLFTGPGMGWLVKRLERPRVTRLESLAWETERHATITFRDEAIAHSRAGSFCMVWVPGVDEVPMGTGYTDAEGRVTLTVEAKGDCTRALLALQPGDKIGVRGPYGTGFGLPEAPSRVCFVGGGTGIAPMARGAQQALAAGHDVTVIGGARSKDLLLLHGYLGGEAQGGRIRYVACTDDGSEGFAGNAVACLEAEMGTHGEFDWVAACGPEMMMVKAVELCNRLGVPSQASLERYMKCAFGICDACTVGDGLRVCLEGPVFDADVLASIPEFGVSHRDAAGIMHPW